MINYADWCIQQERFFDTMPRWYWNHTKREEASRKYVVFTQRQNEMGR